MSIRLIALSAVIVPMAVVAQMGAGNQPRDSFSNFDRDRDGVITKSEARESEILDRMDQMDQNLDGEVTETEFNAMDAPGIDTAESGEEPGEEEGDRRAEFRLDG